MSVNVADLRNKLGWSQSELARFLGVADATVNRWEQGKRAATGPSGQALEAVSDVAATADGVRRLQDAARRGDTMRSLLRRALEKDERRGGRT